MKKYFPLANNKQLRSIVNKCKELIQKSNKSNKTHKPIDHQYLIRSHGLNAKDYYNQLSRNFKSCK